MNYDFLTKLTPGDGEFPVGSGMTIPAMKTFINNFVNVQLFDNHREFVDAIVASSRVSNYRASDSQREVFNNKFNSSPDNVQNIIKTIILKVYDHNDLTGRVRTDFTIAKLNSLNLSTHGVVLNSSGGGPIYDRDLFSALNNTSISPCINLLEPQLAIVKDMIDNMGKESTAIFNLLPQLPPNLVDPIINLLTMADMSSEMLSLLSGLGQGTHVIVNNQGAVEVAASLGAKGYDIPLVNATAPLSLEMLESAAISINNVLNNIRGASAQPLVLFNKDAFISNIWNNRELNSSVVTNIECIRSNRLGALVDDGYVILATKMAGDYCRSGNILESIPFHIVMLYAYIQLTSNTPESMLFPQEVAIMSRNTDVNDETSKINYYLTSQDAKVFTLEYAINADIDFGTNIHTIMFGKIGGSMVVHNFGLINMPLNKWQVEEAVAASSANQGLNHVGLVQYIRTITNTSAPEVFTIAEILSHKWQLN